MFTGLVEEIGRVESVGEGRMRCRGEVVLDGIQMGTASQSMAFA